MSEGLPGKLTERHLKMAEERGDDYINYHHVKYSLEELYASAGISRTKPKSKARQNVHRSGFDNSNGEVTESGSDKLEE